MVSKTHTHWTARSILAFLHSHAADLRAMGVRKIGLFGSYLHGDQHADSDMDFLFVMEPMTWTGWMDVWNFLEDSFGVEVDLVPEKDLRPELARRVLAEVRYVEGV